MSAVADYSAREHYRGDVAARYDEERSTDRKWQLEQELMSRLIAELPRGSSILDVPFGTGRYLDSYERGGHRVLGLDISGDMMRAARPSPAIAGMVIGDVTRIPLADRSVDHVVSTRLMNWLPPDVFAQAIGEIARVARHGVILGIRESERLRAEHLPELWRELSATPRASLRRVLRPLLRREHAIRLHPIRAVRAAFAEHRLEIAGCARIDEGTAFSRRAFHHAPLTTYVLRVA